ncbi:hypothetical protein A2258_01720 [Candidatus Uhrbacteria bacterium RIFOXYA2_FULL_41_8]|nr:MAG: hypothetical protein A2258_01720 [Candidatus Uhrbacteria bacterium RIFOXYA2_FULL_41_8]
MKKALMILIPVIVAIIAIVGIVLINRAPKEVIVGGDVDEHGCIASAGYLWCEARQECIRIWETKCDDEQMKSEVPTIASDILTQTGIDLGEASDTTFQWLYGQEDEVLFTNVQALSYTLDPVLDEDYQKIRSYFMDAGFENDPYNAASGTVVGAEGFKRAITVCQLRYEINVPQDAVDEILLEDFDTYPKSLTLTCGLVDKVDLAIESVEYQLRKAIAEQVDVKVSQVAVEISQESDNSIRGIVTFDDVESVKDGIFYARKFDNTWDPILTQGNPIDCDIMQGYGYPESILEDCAGK